MKTVGTYEAKTRLSELIASVNDTGEPVAITNHGTVVALLSPPPAKPLNNATSEAAWKRWQETRKGTSLNGLRVRDLINEGRR